MTSPLVSVCIPTFNRGHLLQQALESAVTQTLRNLEILVVDDCSDENITSIVHGINDARVRYYRNPENLGMVANFSRCAKLARGRFVSILHTDDYYESEILERESQFLATHSSVSMVYTAYYLAHELSGQTKVVRPYPQDRIFVGTTHVEDLMRKGNHVAFSSVMVRKSCYERVGEFQTSLPYTSDLEMWLRLSLRYPVGYLAIPLVTWRLHREMESFKFFRSAQGVDQEWQAIQMAIEQTPWPGDERERCLKRARWCLARRTMIRAFFHADKGMSVARKHLAKAAHINPAVRLHPMYWLIYTFTLLGDKAFSMFNRTRIVALQQLKNCYLALRGTSLALRKHPRGQ
jgi:glycosyltransferase involved in cell wall biosynthesis